MGNNTPKKGGKHTIRAMQAAALQLPYDYGSLTWDQNHLSNEQQIYCYCGGRGEWCIKMLQCHQCKQWFHEDCIRCLEKPLYFGDRFFVFLCSVCCDGPEIIRRLKLSWVDVVHLVIYNMTVIENKTYFDIDNCILPTIARSMSLLQLPREFLDTSKDDRQAFVMEVLQNNQLRFKCGREIRKRSSLWGLRSRAPPAVPEVQFGVEQFAKKMALHVRKKNIGICRTSSSRRRGKSEEVRDVRVPRLILTEPKNVQRTTPAPKLDNLAPDYTFKKIRRSLTSVFNVIQKRPKPLPAVVNPKVKKAKVAQKMVARKGTLLHGKQISSSSGASGNQQCSSTSVVREESLLGTLETIIPPPSDFKGTNNPFYLPSDRRAAKRKRPLQESPSSKRRCTRLSLNGGSPARLAPSSPTTENHRLNGALPELDGGTYKVNGRVHKVNGHVLKVNGRAHKINGRVHSTDKPVSFNGRAVATLDDGPKKMLRTSFDEQSPGRFLRGRERRCATDGPRKDTSPLPEIETPIARCFSSSPDKWRMMATRLTTSGKVQHLMEWNGDED